MNINHNRKTGLDYFWRGWQVVWQPGNRRYIYIPLCLNALIFIALIGIGVHFFSLFTHWLDLHLPSWLHWLNALLWLMYYVIALLISGYLFTWLSHIIAAPFYGLLSEHIQNQNSNQPCPSTSWHQLILEFPRQLSRQAQLLAYMVPRAVGILLLTLIPGINLIATILWFVFGAWMQAMQYFDYPIDNNGQSFDELKQWLRQNRLDSLSFGGVITVLLMVPILNWFILPAAVAGATLMWVDRST